MDILIHWFGLRSFMASAITNELAESLTVQQQSTPCGDRGQLRRSYGLARFVDQGEESHMLHDASYEPCFACSAAKAV